MGCFDGIIRMANDIKRKAESALETTKKLAEEMEHKLRKLKESAKDLAKEITSKIDHTAEDIRHDLERLTPSFENKLKEVIDQITDVAEKAAEEGVDITEAINGAVDVAFKAAEDALNAAKAAIDDFFSAASKKVFAFLEGFIPQFFLNPIRAKVDDVLKDLASFGEKLKNKINLAVQEIKSTVQTNVIKIGQQLGPVWDFVKKLWKILFGVEPEQCALTAAWFDERMKRTTTQLLSRRSREPVGSLIKKHTFLELLPPGRHSWTPVVLHFLDQVVPSSFWSEHQAQMRSLLFKSSPQAGSLIQVIMDEPFTDRLGGRQRQQIGVLYYRWRTEEFSKVSSGFLGIVAMTCTVGREEEVGVPPVQMIPRDPPLQMNATSIKSIYKEIEPYLRLNRVDIDKEAADINAKAKNTSRQLMSRDENGVWIRIQDP